MNVYAQKIKTRSFKTSRDRTVIVLADDKDEAFRKITNCIIKMQNENDEVKNVRRDGGVRKVLGICVSDKDDMKVIL